MLKSSELRVSGEKIATVLDKGTRDIVGYVFQDKVSALYYFVGYTVRTVSTGYRSFEQLIQLERKQNVHYRKRQTRDNGLRLR